MGMCIGKSRGKIARMALALVGIIAIGSIVAATAAFAALDTPHNFIVNCETCHPTTPPDYWWTNQGGASNTLCGQCHYPGSPYKDAIEHITSSKYGNLDLTCSTCHHPHSQSQMRTWKNVAGAPNAFKTTALTTSATQTTLTRAGANWSTNQWAGMVLVPNTVYLNYNYKILSNTATVITIDGARNDKINLTYAGVGKTFGITYGREVKEAISGLPVKFFGKTGQNSYADGDATIDGVCQVCHTQTQSFNNYGNLETGSHPGGKAGTDCTGCHNHTDSTGAFMANCTSCHGSPPTETSIGGPNGLAKYDDNSGTGSTTVGKHLKHADSTGSNLGYDCTTCHTGYVMPQSTKTIDIGFKIFGMQGGTFSGQAGLNYAGHNGTTATNGGAQTCSNIYCHSEVQAGNGTGAPNYKSAQWTAAATVVCGNCHLADGVQGTGTTMNSGSHTKHMAAPSVTCDSCHTNYGTSTHVDGNINLTVSSTMSGVPQAGFGTCTTMCHNNGANNNPGTTPTWGQTGTGCNTCHATPPTTGAHNKHLSGTLYHKTDCADCHNGANAATNTPSTQHLDGDVDVYKTSPSDLGYPADKAKGSAYSTCATAYCHSSGQSITNGNSSAPNYAIAAPNWGGTAACGSCHAASATALNSGSHNKHLNTVGVDSCTSCHTGATNAPAYNSTAHVDGEINVASSLSYTAGANAAPGNGYGSCTTMCHNNGANNNPGSTPTWGAPGGCSTCHATPPTTGAHNKHLSSTLYHKATCGDCHVNADAATNTAPSTHLNNVIDVYDTTSGDLGYPAAKAKGSPYSTCTTAYCHSSGQSITNGNSSAPNYAVAAPNWGGTVACGSCHAASATALNSGSHNKHLNTVGVDSCTSCHTGATNAPAYNSTAHADGQIDVASTLSYTAGANAVPGNGYGSCTTMCHNDGASNNPGSTPNWGAPGGCSTCHLTPPTTGAHTKHLSGLSASGNFTSNATCGNCHANADAATNTAPSTHLNNVIDVFDTVSGDLGYPAAKAKGSPYNTCNSTYCHSNGGSPVSYAAPNWGGATTGCNFCHAALPATGAHAKHVKTSPAKYGGLRVGTNNGNDFDCGNCHPAGISSHMDGTLQVSLASTDGGTLKSKNSTAAVNTGMVRSPGTNVVCNAAYCHSNGAGANVNPSPNWYAGPYGGDTCAECHGNYPNTGSHNAHVVGIHWDNVYTGSVGLSAAGNLASSSHGNSTSSTTINCNACHFETVTVSYNDSGTTCSTAGCHGAGGKSMGALNSASIAGTNAHLNGAANLAFAGSTPKSRAQVRDDISTVAALNNNWSRPGSSYKTGATPYDTARFNLSSGSFNAGHTCSNITCHNGYPATWGTTASCTTCHMELP